MRYEYKTRYDWVGKVIHKELCKMFKFPHTNKWYMHNSEFVLENEALKVLWDFEIQTNYLISPRWQDSVIVNGSKKRENPPSRGLSPTGRLQRKLKEGEKRDEYLDLARELKKLWNMKSDGDTNRSWYTWNDHKGLVKKLKDLEIRRQVEDIQTTTLLSSARIVKGTLVTWRDLLSLNPHRKTIC